VAEFVVHGDEYITLSEESVDGLGLEWCVFVPAEAECEGIILEGAV
jgi:hypothetical protein